MDEREIHSQFDSGYIIYDKKSKRSLFFHNLRIQSIREMVERYGDSTGSVLDVGCGRGEILSIFKEAKFKVGVDISFSLLRDAKKGNYIRAIGENLPLKSDAFDVIICSETIEYVPKLDEFIEEIYRVLKSEGILVLTTRNKLSWANQFCTEKINTFFIPRALQRKLGNLFKVVNFDLIGLYEPVTLTLLTFFPGHSFTSKVYRRLNKFKNQFFYRWILLVCRK